MMIEWETTFEDVRRWIKRLLAYAAKQIDEDSDIGKDEIAEYMKEALQKCARPNSYGNVIYRELLALSDDEKARVFWWAGGFDEFGVGDVDWFDTIVNAATELAHAEEFMKELKKDE